MLKPSTPTAERILIMGSPGSGKTRAMMTWADWIIRTNSPSRVFYIKTDKPIDVDLAGWPTLRDCLIPLEVVGKSWPEYRLAANKVREEAVAGRNDLLVLDMADTTWNKAQAYYIERAYRTQHDEWFMDVEIEIAQTLEEAKAKVAQNPMDQAALEALKAAKNDSPYRRINWQAVNAIYNAFMEALDSFPGHVLVLTGEDKLNTQGGWADEADTLARYSRVGVKPAGQKKLGHHFHTELRMYQAGPGQWFMTTVRETTGPSRNREMMVHRKVEDFVADYLLSVAGWEL